MDVKPGDLVLCEFYFSDFKQHKRRPCTNTAARAGAITSTGSGRCVPCWTNPPRRQRARRPQRCP